MHTSAAAIAGKKEWWSYQSKPPSIAGRTFKVPRRSPTPFFLSTLGLKNILLLLFFIYPRPKEFITAPLARPLRDMADQTQMFITDNQDTIAMSDNNFCQPTKTHNVTNKVEKISPQKRQPS